jgi:hypothetical protein
LLVSRHGYRVETAPPTTRAAISGRSIRRRACGRWPACGPYLERIVAHLLKLEHSRIDEPRDHWRGEIAAFRADLNDTLTGALEAILRGELCRRFQRARKLAVESLAEREPDLADRLPSTCPYSFEQITGHWLPERPALSAPRRRRS